MPKAPQTNPRTIPLPDPEINLPEETPKIVEAAPAVPDPSPVHKDVARGGYHREPDMSIEDLHKEILARREQAESRPQTEPPQMTTRQRSRIEEEMKAGQERNAFYAEQQRRARPPAPTQEEGKVTPVFRPGDKVPNFSEGHLGSKTLSE